MENTNKKAFTLVELIVVITILVILATIAFISLQWFSKYARNSTRASDLASINKVLSLYVTEKSEYPLPTDWKQVTYSWSEVWTQWTFWASVRKTIWTNANISEIVVDPLTGNEYTYSVLNTRREYQIAWVLEWENAQAFNNLNIWAPNTYAVDYSADYWTTIIKWNYNWSVLKIWTCSNMKVLAVPSIVAWDLSESKDLIDIINSKKLILNKSKTLPSSYRWTTKFLEKLPIKNIINIESILTYTWSCNNLRNEEIQYGFVENLRNAYNWTELKNNNLIKLVLTTSPTLNPDKVLYISQTIINRYIDYNLKIIANSKTPNIYTPDVFISTWDLWIDEWKTWTWILLLPFNWPNKDCNFTVDWWDWTTNIITDCDQEEMKHNYWKIWSFNVAISWNSIKGFGMKPTTHDNEDDWDKLIDIKQWWNVILSNWWFQFIGTNNIVKFSAFDTPNLNEINNLMWMFGLSTKFNWYINNWNVSSIENMSSMFRWANSFNKPLNDWNVSSVKNMSLMFLDASNFNQPLNKWNISNVTNTSWMFAGYLNWPNSFNQNISNWKTSSVLTMDSMFRWTTNFNQPLNDWNVSLVKNMHAMFYDSVKFNQDLNKWDTSNLETIKYMFAASNWKTMDFNGNISPWDTWKIAAMDNTFTNSTSFNKDISNWNIINVSEVDDMFRWAISFNQDLSNWNTKWENITVCSNFDKDATSWELSKPIFENCDY